MQIYKDCNVGSGKPDDAILKRYHHHLINHIDLNDTYNVARFVSDTWMTYGLVCSPIMFLAIVVTALGTHRHIKDLHSPEIQRKTPKVIFSELYETMTVSKNYIILFIAMIMMLSLIHI